MDRQECLSYIIELPSRGAAVRLYAETQQQQKQLMNPLFRKRPLAQNDLGDLSGIPEPTFWGKWGGGLAVPIYLVVRGALAMYEKNIEFRWGRVPSMQTVKFSGEEAFWFGIAVIFFGIFFHFHCFWNSYLRLQTLAHIGKLISIIGFLLTFGYTLWLFFTTWF